ncbi:MAG: DUF3307 domain-containing protein [Verrucomicrobiota bacterium]
MSSLIQQGPFALFAAFLVMHALADFPLQGDYIAKQKARRQADSNSVWIIALTAHCIIHAGGVWLVSGSLALGCVEFVLHAMIDIGKGEEKFGLVADQTMHVACKLAYVLLFALGWLHL